MMRKNETNKKNTTKFQEREKKHIIAIALSIEDGVRLTIKLFIKSNQC